MNRLVPLLLCALSAGAFADIRLPALFSDHMVLQRESTIAFWGWADPGEEVSIESTAFQSAAKTTADAGGRFEFRLPTGPAGGPHIVRLSGRNSVELQDVLLGEVWIASGQSNMEWPIGPQSYSPGILEWQREVERADTPLIREFEVINAVAAAPVADCKGVWRVASPQTAGDFSAVGYFHARQLSETLGVPVGILATNWGGTRVEAWCSKEVLRSLKSCKDELDWIEKLGADPEGEQAKAARAWREGFENAVAKSFPSLAARAADARPALPADARKLHVPGEWKGEWAAFDGFMMLWRNVEVPASWEGRALRLELGPIDDIDTTWFGEVKVSAAEADGMWATPRRYIVPASVVRAGALTLCVRVLDTGGGGGLVGRPEELRIYPEGEESAAIPLAGDWSMLAGARMSELPAWPSVPALHANSASALFNAMIAPLTPFTVRGALWYQGESNRGSTTYASHVASMVEDWRARFDCGPFAFYFVQIAPYDYRDSGELTARLREQQDRTRALLPNSAMVVTMDVGDPADIHPLRKQIVGRRLADLALQRIHGIERVVDSPEYLSVSYSKGRALLYLSHAAGLRSEGEPALFQIAGSDRRFVPAKARIIGDTIELWSEQVAEPKAVRYGWCEACEGNVWNGAGLPLAPFRTDRD